MNPQLEFAVSMIDVAQEDSWHQYDENTDINLVMYEDDPIVNIYAYPIDERGNTLTHLGKKIGVYSLLTGKLVDSPENDLEAKELKQSAGYELEKEANKKLEFYGILFTRDDTSRFIEKIDDAGKFSHDLDAFVFAYTQASMGIQPFKKVIDFLKEYEPGYVERIAQQVSSELDYSLSDIDYSAQWELQNLKYETLEATWLEYHNKDMPFVFDVNSKSVRVAINGIMFSPSPSNFGGVELYASIGNEAYIEIQEGSVSELAVRFATPNETIETWDIRFSELSDTINNVINMGNKNIDAENSLTDPSKKSKKLAHAFELLLNGEGEAQMNDGLKLIQDHLGVSGDIAGSYDAFNRWDDADTISARKDVLRDYLTDEINHMLLDYDNEHVEYGVDFKPSLDAVRLYFSAIRDVLAAATLVDVSVGISEKEIAEYENKFLPDNSQEGALSAIVAVSMFKDGWSEETYLGQYRLNEFYKTLFGKEIFDRASEIKLKPSKEFSSNEINEESIYRESNRLLSVLSEKYTALIGGFDGVGSEFFKEARSALSGDYHEHENIVGQSPYTPNEYLIALHAAYDGLAYAPRIQIEQPFGELIKNVGSSVDRILSLTERFDAIGDMHDFIFGEFELGPYYKNLKMADNATGMGIMGEPDFELEKRNDGQYFVLTQDGSKVLAKDYVANREVSSEIAPVVNEQGSQESAEPTLGSHIKDIEIEIKEKGLAKFLESNNAKVDQYVDDQWLDISFPIDDEYSFRMTISTQGEDAGISSISITEDYESDQGNLQISDLNVAEVSDIIRNMDMPIGFDANEIADFFLKNKLSESVETPCTNTSQDSKIDSLIALLQTSISNQDQIVAELSQLNHSLNEQIVVSAREDGLGSEKHNKLCELSNMIESALSKNNRFEPQY